MPTLTDYQITEAFRDAIQSVGITPPKQIVADGKLRRFSTNGKKDDDSGWYVLHGDGIPAGAFGCWRSEIKQNWCAGKLEAMTDQERTAYRKRMQKICEQRDAEERTRHVKAALRAREILDNAKPAPVNHPYLLRKKVTTHGLRVDAANRLIVPVRIGGTLSSLQFIDENGNKRFLLNGATKDRSFTLGDPTNAETILETEGYATGATLHEVTGLPVVVAFNAGNLEPVAKNLRAEYPTVKLVICADNDFHADGKPNAGLLAAEKAAKAVNGILAVPPVLDGGKTDWNDVYVKQGVEAVRACIQGAMTSPTASKGNSMTDSEPGDSTTEEILKATEAKPQESSDPPSKSSDLSLSGGPGGLDEADASQEQQNSADHQKNEGGPKRSSGPQETIEFPPKDGEASSPYTPSKSTAHLHTPPALAQDPNILARFGHDIQVCGVVGEVRCAKLIYLMATSRLLDEPVSGTVKGISSSGKSYTVETTLKFVPEKAVIVMTAMSERALIYMKEEFSHRTLVIYEASALREQREKNESNLTAYFVRSLLSEGRIVYPVTVRDKEKGWATTVITKKGPTNVILTTTATELHGENETRMLSIPTNDSQEQTKAIMKKLAEGKSQTVDFKPWHELQEWLAQQKRQVVIPYAPYLAEQIPPVAVRLRRDFRSLLRLIEAHAVLHQQTREHDDQKRIIATEADYLAVRELVADLIADGVGATVSKTIRETVEAVSKEDKGEGVTVKTVSDALKLDRSAAQRRIQTARGKGYLVNQEEQRGKPARYAVGDPLPEEIDLLPLSLPEGVQHTPLQCDTSMHSLSNRNHKDILAPVQVCSENGEEKIEEPEEVFLDEA